MTESGAIESGGNPVLAALEAFNRAHPRRTVDIDDVRASAATITGADPSAADGEHDPTAPVWDPVDYQMTLSDIALGPDDVRWATEIGELRHDNARAAGRRDRYGPVDDAKAKDVNAAGAELGTARWLGVPWEPAIDGADTGRAIGDVGGYQVRSTEVATYSLILHEEDPPDGRRGDDPDDVAILVTGRMPDYVLRGWLRIGDGQRPQYWRDGATYKWPAFFVPQKWLHNMTSLPRR